MNRLAPLLLAGALLASAAEAVKHVGPGTPVPPPWFTGPLIAQSATVITSGHINFEPYFNATNNCAAYNNHWKSVNQPDFWSLNAPLPLWIGISPWADIIIQPTAMWNRTGHAANWALGDLNVGLEIQAVQGSSKGTWRPSIKLAIREVFPTGKYRNSSPAKQRTDLGGMGAYATQFWIMAGRIEHVYGDHFFHWELNLNYSLPSTVHVKGINAYGGGAGTNGYVTPGSALGFDLGMEYNVSRHWALAMDVVANWQSGAHFRGAAGTAPGGSQASNSPPASVQYSLAPALEYNFSANLGLIGGVWFTVAGKNSTQFVSGSIALNYYR